MASVTDYNALGTQIAQEQVNLSVAVESCAALGPDQKADWYDLARRCVTYSGYGSLYESGAGSWGALVDRGRLLWEELATWRATLTALGCTPPALHDVPAPPPHGRPNSLLTALGTLGDALPVVLVFLVVREWNEARK